MKISITELDDHLKKTESGVRALRPDCEKRSSGRVNLALKLALAWSLFMAFLIVALFFSALVKNV